MATAVSKRAGQHGKSIEEVVAYAVSHRIRVQILIVLNQGTYTTAEIADVIGEPLNRVGNHIRELVDAGSIEIADTKRRRNAQQHYYRAVRTPFFTDADAEDMTWQQRQVTAGLVIQSLVAEMMAALWAGNMFDDARDWLTWDRFNLDAEGRQELFEEQEESWKRLEAVKARATNRVAKSGEETAPYVVGVLGFGRVLKAPEPSHSVDPE
ncbi:MAG: winged helix-turn-helix transcriptional regulator [Actinobacteria bacterium]|nr:winged helix-turn-helix transcriptional regulator [Actinomycetota bacterium]